VIWFCAAVTTARSGTSSHPGSPTRAASPATRPAIPDRPCDASLDRSRAACLRAAPDTRRGRTTIMAAKPKPQTTDEAREQARRALQTSMDTRQ
jgi:hypothetical protein